MSGRFSVPQWCAIGGCAAVLLWSIPGLFINPDFRIGADATSELFLGVDMNGWHAVSGFLIVIPVLAVFRNAELLDWLLGASAFALYGTALWATLSERRWRALLLPEPHRRCDPAHPHGVDLPGGRRGRFQGPSRRSSARLILPLAVFGSSSANSMRRGYLYGAVTSLT